MQTETTTRGWDVIPTNQDAPNLTDALGISEERRIELNEAVKERLKDQDSNLSADIQKLSNIASNAEESAYMIFVYGDTYAKTTMAMERLMSGVMPMGAKEEGGDQ